MMQAPNPIGVKSDSTKRYSNFISGQLSSRQCQAQSNAARCLLVVPDI